MHGNQERKVSLVDSIELFKGVANLQDAAISDRCHWHRYPKGSQILSSDEHSTDIFFIVRGEVVVRSFSADGKEVSYTEIGSGGLFGEFSAIDGKPRSASVDAIDDCLIARMPSAEFRSLLLDHSAVGLRLVELLVAKNRILTQRIFEYGTLPVRARIQQELLRLSAAAAEGANQFEIDPAPTHYEIATRIATHREAVSRELNLLAIEKIIQIDRRRIRILDLERLREFHGQH